MDNKKNIANNDQKSTLEDTVPYHSEVNPNQLLLEIESQIRRFIVCNEETVVAAVLWIAMTWFIDVIQVSPLAVITAPEKRCGKSQLLFLLGRLVKCPLPASNITPSALFRSIDKWQPTILIDEADTFIKDNEELRGILNCGHTRDSAFIIRTEGKDFQPRQFNVWGAKALAGIGHLPNTIMDRAITLKLRRKLPNEKVERLRYGENKIFKLIKSKLARFAMDNKEILLNSRPELPEQLNDRAQDNWEPLFAIANIAGNDWPNRAKAAALVLSDIDNASLSLGTELLLSIQEMFERKGIDRISTADLIQELCLDEEQPWAAYKHGQPITPRQIASILKEYNIQSKSVRIGCGIPKGFERSQFHEAFSRYLTPSASVENIDNIRNTTQFNTHALSSVAEQSIVSATRPQSATL